MTLRKVPGALALGLLASLTAHFALYGQAHQVGGDYHFVLLSLAFGGALSLLLFFGIAAVSAATVAINGNVLAARLRERLPGFGLLFAAAATWYTAAEWVEPRHADASPVALILVLVTACALVLSLGRAVVTALAGAVIAVWRATFSPRLPSWSRRSSRPLRARRLLRTHRRFARPPPIAIGCRA